MDNQQSQFLAFLRACLVSPPSLVKLVLSRPGPQAEPEIQRADARLVQIGGQTVLSWTLRYARRTETKNQSLDEVAASVEAGLGPRFMFADLRTTSHDHSLRIGRKGTGHLVSKAVSVVPATVTNLEHDHQRHRFISPLSPWLRVLGISDDLGRIIPRMHDKYRQIDKFVEIIDDLLPIQDSIHFVDMGSGKAYLSFALYAHFSTRTVVQGLGLEQRADLVEKSKLFALQANFAPHLDFIQGDIGTWHHSGQTLDLLVALHACDTATDDAIVAGIKAGARVIVCSPCCHKQVRRDMQAPSPLDLITQHGILHERFAEMVTDAVRALVLEAYGYRAKVFEFIDPEHSGKNLMISAVFDPALASSEQREAKLAQAHGLMKHCGAADHYLLTKLTN